MGTLRSRIRPGLMNGEARRVEALAAEAWVEESRRRIPGHWKLHDNLRAEKKGRQTRVVSDAVGMGGVRYSAVQNYGGRHTPPLGFWEPGRRAAEQVIRRARLRP